jgi:hypothetical protein
MVQITQNQNEFIFEIKGIHKFWALRNKIVVPKQNIENASKKEEESNFWIGWRLPGTRIPGLITAGTFVKNGERHFWDVCKSKNAIVVNLKNSSFKKLIIEVENPSESIELLNSK